MAGITRYTWTYNVRTGVVGVGIEKTNSSMTVAAFSIGDWVRAGRGVSRGWRLTNSYSTVMAS